MPKLLYTDYQKFLYASTFDAMKQNGYFNQFGSAAQPLPFAINQDGFGAYNIGFFMWQAGREQTIDDMVTLCETATSVAQVKARLLALRKMELGEDAKVAKEAVDLVEYVQ